MRKYQPTPCIHASPQAYHLQVRCVGEGSAARSIICIAAGKSVFNLCHSFSTYFTSLRCPVSLISGGTGYRKLRYDLSRSVPNFLNLMILTVTIEIFNSKRCFHVYSAQTNFRVQTWPTITLPRLKRTLTD
jgi:hypothetical protein